jgi:hypothetical protein
MDTLVENTHQGVAAAAAKMLTDPVAAFDAVEMLVDIVPLLFTHAV